MDIFFCSWCGRAVGDGDHDACRARLALVDPPRYCPACARRMVVQVDPMGWTARCSRHGETSEPPAEPAEPGRVERATGERGR